MGSRPVAGGEAGLPLIVSSIVGLSAIITPQAIELADIRKSHISHK
jgi:hypothetical protein